MHALTKLAGVAARRRSTILLMLAALGCTGTDTGNPLGDGARSDRKGGTKKPGSDGESSSGLCRALGKRVVAEDEVIPLGFSAGELLANVASERSEGLRWLPLTIAEYGPEHDQQSLSIRVERTAAAIQLVDYERRTDIGEIGGDCPDQLEIEVDVELESTGGALREQLRTTLYAQSPELARLSQRFEPEQLGGSFAVSKVNQEGFMLESLTLNLSFTRFGVNGELYPSFEKRTADSVGQAAGGPLAIVGLAACQGDGNVAVPSSARVAEFSGDDVLALFAANKAAHVSWSDGSESDLTLAFEPSEQGVCAALLADVAGQVGALTMAGDLVAKSGDGRIDARWAVVASARPAPTGGALEQVELVLDNSVPRVDWSLSDDYGLHGFDVSAYDYLGVSVMLNFAPGRGWSGKVQVTGFEEPDCSSTPMVDENGGVSSNGCMGSTPHQVASGTLSVAK